MPYKYGIEEYIANDDPNDNKAVLKAKDLYCMFEKFLINSYKNNGTTNQKNMKI